MSHPKRHIVSHLEDLEARIAPATIYIVDDSNHLLSFDSATPGTVAAPKTFTGLTDVNNEKIKGIDFRPADGKMYALGVTVIGGADNDEGRIYTVDFSGANAVLTQVGGTPFFSTFETAADFGFDINPSADRIRVVTDGDKNLRVNPNTGALAGTDFDLTSGGNPSIVGTAYDRNFDGPAATTLYGIDNSTDMLVRLGGIDGNPSPNGGVVTNVGPLNVAFTDFKVGFDIQSRTGTAYAVIRPTNTTLTSLYTINLQNGGATLIGTVQGNPTLNGLTVALPDDLKILNPTTAVYGDQDGDLVTVKITGAAPGASLSKDDFRFSTGQFGSQLKLLNFSDDGQEWAKSSISILATPFNGKGDSFATVGYIKANGVDLGKVIVNGDLGQIDAGDATTNTAGLASLSVQSMGVYFNSQLPTSLIIPNQTSDIVGKLGALIVKGDFTREQINVTGGAVDGAIGNIIIGGDFTGIGFLASSGINSTGPMANIAIGGSIFGGSSANIGSIIAQGNSSIGNITVNGSIYGGDGTNTAVIEGFNLGNVIVKGSVVGGTADHAGGIHAKGTMGNVIVAGSIVGGDVPSTNEFDAGIIYTTGPKIGAVKIGGSLVGTVGSFSGSLYSAGTMGTVTIGGSLQGDGTRSAEIQAASNIGAVKIGGDMIGGSGLYSGSVLSINGSIASVTVGGSVTGNGNASTGIIAGNQLGAVKITGSLAALSPAGVRISAQGLTTGSTLADAKAVGAIASVSITGSVKNALILGGYSPGGVGTNPDATIGNVTVGGNWISSSLVAGVRDTNLDGFGNPDDLKINEGAVDPLFSKIGAITIKGYVAGTPSTVNNSDHFGFISEQIGILKVGVRTYTLAAGTDLTGFVLGTTGDVFFREVV